MAIRNHPILKSAPELPFGLSLDTVAHNLREIVQIGMTPDQQKQRLGNRHRPSDLFTDIWEHELHRAINNSLWCIQEQGLISGFESGLLRRNWFEFDGIKPDFSFLVKGKPIVMEVKIGSSTTPSKLKNSISHHSALRKGQFWIICIRYSGTLDRFWRSINIPNTSLYYSDPTILSGASCTAFMGFQNN